MLSHHEKVAIPLLGICILFQHTSTRLHNQNMMRPIKAAFFVALIWTQEQADAFAPSWKQTSAASSLMRLLALPSIEQLSKDPFMKQVAHASEIVPLLSIGRSEDVALLLQAQLSHSDGIRGFFVVYLTGQGSNTVADAPTMPSPLASVLKNVADKKDLISLACMNVIMPTAMSTMHNDRTLRQNSSKTADRAVFILKYLAKLYPEQVKSTCEAIMAATRDTESPLGEQALYWREFFSNYQYEDQQRKDILSAFASIDFQGQTQNF